MSLDLHATLTHVSYVRHFDTNVPGPTCHSDTSVLCTSFRHLPYTPLCPIRHFETMSLALYAALTQVSLSATPTQMSLVLHVNLTKCRMHATSTQMSLALYATPTQESLALHAALTQMS